MNKEFCSNEISLKLKELGFNEECFGYYLGNSLFITNDIVYNSTNIPVIKAPIYQQIVDFFREKHNIIIEVWYDITQIDVDGFTWLYEIYVNNTEFEHDGSYFDNFYECREQSILKAIELISLK